MRRPRRALGRLKRLVLASGALLAGCMGKEPPESAASPIDPGTADDLKKLSRLRVYFGHQSVGENVMEGLEDLKKATGVEDFNVLKLKPGTALPPAFFAHGGVGGNRDPKSKFDGFTSVLDGELAGKVDVAFMKLCYVDIDKETDVDAVFRDYVAMVDAVKARHPDVTLVHVTSPLMVKEGWNRLKYVVKQVMGVENDNVRRNRFNQMLRERFAGQPIFDLETIESTYWDGTRETFNDGKNYGLVRAYTYDGGHLNELGRQRVARELVRFLTKLPVAERPSDVTTSTEAAAPPSGLP